MDKKNNILAATYISYLLKKEARIGDRPAIVSGVYSDIRYEATTAT